MSPRLTDAISAAARASIAIAAFATLQPSHASEPAIRQIPRADGASTPIWPRMPATPACQGVAVLSHGAGGSVRGLAYLGEALAQQGWLTVAVGHSESGPQALREHGRVLRLRRSLSALTTDAAAYEARFSDIGAALSWAQTQCLGQPRALIGHSMGAATAVLEAGARNKLGLVGAHRFDAYVALSPQGVGAIFPPGAWHQLAMPFLMITGTQDQALEGDWRTRLQPFDNLPGPCQWQAVIDGATHMDLGGGGGTHGRAIQPQVIQTTLSFLAAIHSSKPPSACALPAATPGVTLSSK